MTVNLSEGQKAIINYLVSRRDAIAVEFNRRTQELQDALRMIAVELGIDVTQDWNYRDGAFVRKETGSEARKENVEGSGEENVEENVEENGGV